MCLVHELAFCDEACSVGGFWFCCLTVMIRGGIVVNVVVLYFKCRVL